MMSGTAMDGGTSTRASRRLRSRQVYEQASAVNEVNGECSALDQSREQTLDWDACNTIMEDYSIFDPPIPFISVQKWKNVCLERYEWMVAETAVMATHYLAFFGMSKEDLEKIDRSRRHLPSMRFLYDSELELLIVKFMVGKAHEWCGNAFAQDVLEKVRSRCGDHRVLRNMGSFRCESGGRLKEPDVALVPPGRDLEKDWPSVVFEVGVSETLSALRNDAHFWITKSGGLTRVVLLFAVDVLAKTIVIERWGHLPSVCPSHVVGGLNICARMIQTVSVDRSGVVIGAPLLLPSDLVFDIERIPQGVLATDFSFDVQDLILFSTEFWGALN